MIYIHELRFVYSHEKEKKCMDMINYAHYDIHWSLIMY